MSGQQRLHTWVVAVSGGVDSMALLDMVHQFADRRIIVAHADHGIRPDSADDADFVRSVAADLGLTCETTRLRLRGRRDEATARRERYRWLEGVRRRYDASAIVTAHHQDDVLETVLLNLRRGTGWRGIASLRSRDHLQRPLLTKSKAEIVAYALARGLEWREDSTNDDVRYLRNAIRHGVVPRLNVAQRRQLLALYHRQCELRSELEAELAELHERATTQRGLSRYWLTMIEPAIAHELLAHHLGERLERPRSQQLLGFVRAAQPGAVHVLPGGKTVKVTADELIV